MPSKSSTMVPGGSIGKLKSHSINQPNQGGMKKNSGPPKGYFKQTKMYRDRTYTTNKNMVFSLNTMGGVGANKSMFKTGLRSNGYYGIRPLKNYDYNKKN